MPYNAQLNLISSIYMIYINHCGVHASKHDNKTEVQEREAT